jgi:hypothetical protein
MKQKQMKPKGKNRANRKAKTSVVKSNVTSNSEILFEIYPDEGNRNNIVLATVAGVGAAKGKKAKAVAKELTDKQKATIKGVVTKEVKALSSGDTVFEIITIAPELSKKNPLDLYGYCTDRIIRVISVPAYATCTPTPASIQLIADELFPYVNLGIKIPTEDKKERDKLAKQLREGFTNMALSCVTLSNGNKPMFAITRIKTKAPAVRNTKRLPAPDVKINDKLGGNTLGVSTKKNKYAISYTIMYGVGDDQSKWTTQVGGANQLLEGLTAGDNINIIMWANTGKKAGYPSPVQSRRVPFN